MASYLEFVYCIKAKSDKRKTVVVNVLSQMHRYALGQIKWYAHWRQYVFVPLNDTIYNKDCLKEISEFLLKINVEHKDNRKIQQAKEQK